MFFSFLLIGEWQQVRPQLIFFRRNLEKASSSDSYNEAVLEQREFAGMMRTFNRLRLSKENCNFCVSWLPFYCFVVALVVAPILMGVGFSKKKHKDIALRYGLGFSGKTSKAEQNRVEVVSLVPLQHLEAVSLLALVVREE